MTPDDPAVRIRITDHHAGFHVECCGCTWGFTHPDPDACLIEARAHTRRKHQ